MKILKNLHWAVYLLFLLACARQSSPTGGPKDTIPPSLVRSNPADQQLNFKGKTIELVFNEAVQLNNPKEQLIITPNVGKDFNVVVKNTRVILTLDKDLRDSTTYAFNFRDAVQDITEKNPVRNLKVAVSTGTYIDSLSIAGTVKEVTEQKVLKDATVALQPASDTFNIFKHQATYFSKSDDKGQFVIENIKAGSYIIFAFQDKNKNLVVDSKSEMYGFLAQAVKIDSTTSGIKLNLVKLDARQLKVTSARPYNTYFNIKAGKNLSDFALRSDEVKDLYATYGEDFANIRLYNSFPDKDSLRINVSLSDSIHAQLDTIVFAKFSNRQVTPEKFSYKVISSHVFADRGLLTATIALSKPLKDITFDSLFFRVDSVTTIPFGTADIDYAEQTRIFTINKKIDKKFYPPKDPEADFSQPRPKHITTANSDANTLYIGTAAFISIEQDSSSEFTQKTPVSRFEDLGTIITQAIAGSEKVLIQLLDSHNTIVQEVKHKDNATFTNLIPADYLLRIVIDRNGNGKWDPGNYPKREEPEEIRYYENEKGTREIQLKANFEIGPLLITY
jgi:uncharacterized protein (DUF2141 family)